MFSLRFRVAVAAGLVAGAVVGVTGLALIGITARDRLGQVDDSLLTLARDAAGPAARHALDDLEPLTDAGTGVRLIDGREVLLSSGGPATPLPPPVKTGRRTVRTDDGRWRTLTVPLGDNAAARDDEPLLEVSASLADVDESRRRLFGRVVFLGLLAAPLGGLAAGLAAGAGLRPLRRLEHTARWITATGDLAARAPENGPAEVAEVARSLNSMLDALARSDAARHAAGEAARGFTQSVAHELRTPLTSLRANLDLLARDDLPADQRREIVAGVRADERRLAALFEALEALARGELAAGRLTEAVDLAEVLDAAVEQARRRRRDATFTVHAPDHAVVLTGWAEGLRVLVDNVLANAAVHGVRPGSPAVVDVWLVDEGGGVRLVVDDAGPGVAPEERERVLTAFARGRSATVPGLGLGLALVAQQARLHGGTVVIGDSPAGGARVEVVLPRRGAAAS